MNIVLLNPKIKTWSPIIYPPLGLAYVASALEGAGHSVWILDCNSHRISDKTLRILIASVDIVGIGGMITEYQEAIRLANFTRNSNYKAKIILGGALATTWTEKVLSNSQADIAVMGEGEETIVKLVKAIDEGEDYSGMKGLACKSNGVVRINPKADPIMDLDGISFPARHLLDMDRYNTHHFKRYGMKIGCEVKSTTMFTSRGCPYNCVFCFKDVEGYKWRGRDADNIIAEIKQLKSGYGFNGFIFNDDTFCLDRQRVKDFCSKVIDEKLNIYWYCNSRVNLMTEEILWLMSKAGCREIAYGLESGNQEILNFINKGITLEQVERITRLTEQAGIYVLGQFMLGMLGETKETIKQTMDFARKLDCSFYSFNITTPMMGTVLYKLAEEKGLITPKESDDFSFHVSSNLTKDCTEKDLENFSKQAFREFTLERRYGKHYRFNPFLWLDGLKSLLFLMGRRSVKQLLEKSLGVIVGR